MNLNIAFAHLLTMKESEDLLADKASGTFLVRVAESRFGYSLSLQFNGRCKHFMVDQDQRGNYVVGSCVHISFSLRNKS